MDNHLEFIEKNKEILKKAWLEYYAKNSAFLDKIVENWFTRVDTPDGGHRVKGEWILGILAGKYSNFSKMLYTIYLGNDNVEKIVEVLGLNFDPKIELEKVKNSTKNMESDTPKTSVKNDDSTNSDNQNRESFLKDFKQDMDNLEREIKKIFTF